MSSIGDHGLLRPLLGEHQGPDQLLRHHRPAEPQERRQEDQQEDLRRLQCGKILLKCSSYLQQSWPNAANISKYVMCLPIMMNPIVIRYGVKLNDGNIGGWWTCKLSQLSLPTRMRLLVSNSFGLLLWCFIADYFQVNCEKFDACCRIIQVKSSRTLNQLYRKGILSRYL